MVVCVTVFPMIRIRNLTFAYGGGPPLFEGFDLEIAPGEAWSVIGPSGCGKSTLLYLLAGLKRPLKGEVLIAEVRVARPRPQTGLVLQDHGLLPWATVGENAGLGLVIRKFYGPDGRHAPAGPRGGPEEGKRRVDGWLERLGILALKDHYPAQLSKGQRQRTAMARTMVLEPDILLMDEPFSALDAHIREDLRGEVMGLQQGSDRTLVIVTHDIEEAIFLGEKLLVLKRGINEKARVIPNGLAGDPDFRTRPPFQEIYSRLRTLLELGS